MNNFSTDETPEYLRGPGFEGLPDELAQLAEESDARRLTISESVRLRYGIRAAMQRVLAARRARDGKAA